MKLGNIEVQEVDYDIRNSFFSKLNESQWLVAKDIIACEWNTAIDQIFGKMLVLHPSQSEKIGQVGLQGDISFPYYNYIKRKFNALAFFCTLSSLSLKKELVLKRFTY